MLFRSIEGVDPSERTEIQIVYDDAAIYVGVRLFDKEPRKIVRQLSRRDDNPDADYFLLQLSPNHDRLTGAPCLGMLPLPVLESVSQRSGQRHTPVALDVFPIADSVHREEKALIDGHVRVPQQIEQTTCTSTELPPTQSSFIKAVSLFGQGERGYKGLLVAVPNKRIGRPIGVPMRDQW